MVHVSSLIAFAMIPLFVTALPIPRNPSAMSVSVAKNAGPKGQSKPLPPTGSTTGKATGNDASKASKLPDHMEGLPKDTHMLAWDEKNHKLVAYDKNKKRLGMVKAVGGKPGNSDPKQVSRSRKSSTPATPKKAAKSKRDNPGGCTPLSIEDAQKLPGWETLREAAEKNWGTGSNKPVTNDEDYLDRPATVCADTATAMITTDPNPSCSEESNQIEGSVTNGSVSVTQQFGTAYSNSMTVTKESSFSKGDSVSVNVGIPDIIDASQTVSFESKFTNSLSTTTVANSSTMTSQTITRNLNGEDSCLLLQTSHCDITGTGKVRYLATGWIWFEYDDQTEGHYKWALNMDSTLTNEDDRSSFLEFKAEISSKTISNFTDKC